MIRRAVGIAVCCLVASGGACTSRKQAADMPPSPKCELSVYPQLDVGDPVQVTFQLINPTAQRLFVLDWHTPLEGLLSNCLVVTRDGVEIPYQGPMLKRGDPEPSDYAVLDPGVTSERTIEAHLAYDFSKPGTYRIAFRGPLMDVITQQAEVPRPLAQHREVPMQCQAVETKISSP